MKKYFGVLFIALAVAVSSGVARGEGKTNEVKKEVAEKIAGVVFPASWGTLRSAQMIDTRYGTRNLYFEDAKGNIRIVYLLTDDTISDITVYKRK
jgi:hypothetical protein